VIKRAIGKNLRYQKFCYWVDPQRLEEAKKNLQEKGMSLDDEDDIPCRVLKASKEIRYVTHRAWNSFCKRRTSWYWNSEKAGKFLIVSNTPLDLPDVEPPVLITESNFKPDRLPSSDEITQLIQLEEYQKRKPHEWDRVDPAEKDFYQRWLKHHGVNKPFHFDEVFLTHSANHANFLNPKFFITLDGTKVPYSISDSLHICSSCIEFFNIIGSEWEVKYVVPCIGAVQFARLPMNKYFRVETRPERK
jgi:hypothetical protein